MLQLVPAGACHNLPKVALWWNMALGVYTWMGYQNCHLWQHTLDTIVGSGSFLEEAGALTLCASCKCCINMTTIEAQWGAPLTCWSVVAKVCRDPTGRVPPTIVCGVWMCCLADWIS
jgi:hypothetical protein